MEGHLHATRPLVGAVSLCAEHKGQMTHLKEGCLRLLGARDMISDTYTKPWLLKLSTRSVSLTKAHSNGPS